MSNSIIRVLLLEDSLNDVMLLQAALEADPLNTFLLTHAETLSQGLSLLDRDSFDLILLDLGLPDSHGLDAFERLHQWAPGLPIVILSGNTDEQVAILAVQAGAQDYIVKAVDNLNMLARSIRYAVERQQIQLELHAREKYWRTLIEQSVDAITAVTADGYILYKSPAARHILGYSPEETDGLNAFDFIFPGDRDAVSQVFAQSLSQPHQPIFSQARFIRKDGTMCWIEATITNWLDDPALQAIIINYRDITHRKQTEEALHQSEERHQQFIAHSFEGIYRTEFDQPIDITLPVETQIDLIYENAYMAECNQALADMYHLPSVNALVGVRLIDAHRGKDNPINRAAFRKLIEQGYKSFNDETFEYNADGQTVWFLSNTVGTIEHGKLVRLWGTSVDITERKRTEAALRESEARLKGFLDAAPDAMVIVNKDGQIIRANTQMEKLFGYSQAELVGLNVDLMVPEQVRSQHSLHRAEFLAEPKNQTAGINREIYARCKDGREFSAEISLSYHRVGDETMVLSAIRDITARKQTEEALRQSEELYRTLVEALDVSLCRWLPDTTLVFTNEKYRRIFGLHNQVTNQKWLNFLPEATREDTAAFYQELADNPRTIAYEHPVTVEDGSVRHYQWVDSPILDAEGKLVAFQSIGIDLTERKQSEELGQAQRDLARLSSSITSEEAAWPVCLEAALRVSGMDCGGIYLFNDSGNALELVYHQGLSADFIQATWCYPVDAPNVQLILIGQSSYFTTDETNGLAPSKREGLTSLAVIPIQSQGQVFGCINVASHTLTQVSEFARHALETIATEIGSIVISLRTASALRESEARAQAMLNAIPDLMFRLDRQGVFLDYKADVHDLYAQAEPTLIGKRNRDISPPEFADLIDQKICTTLETGALQTFEYQLDIPGRGRCDYEARMTPSGEGEVLAVVRDITDRKQVENALRASEEKYRGLMESLDSMVATVDYEGKFLYMNDIAAAQLGSTPEKVIGKTMLELFPEPVAIRQLENIRKAIREDKSYTHENESFIQGNFRWLRTSVQPIHDETGRVIYALVNTTDIHDLKTAQQELQELNRTLEERVKERTTDLSRANAELARAARAKDEFLANMSHELRTPLNAILGLSEALLEQVRGPLNERQQASVRNIETSGRHLLSLISDILDLSKVEAGRLELLIEPTPVADVCQASLLFVKETAQKKQLQVAFHLNNQLARVQADPKRLKQMLVNLLSNAVKFTPERGQVSLEVSADAEARVIRFAVQDSGIGIPPEEVARLFQPFMQLDSSLSRQYEGTGLGLALVRRLAELHGGSVTVESDGVPGHGSRFTIALPYHPAQIEASKSIASEGERKAGTGPLRSALVVEDSESAAEQLTRYLEETNVRAIVHPQGEGALEQAIRLQPGVIFLDLMMPGQSGWEVLAQLKADSRTRQIPVIIVSVVDERGKGLAAGAAAYMVKPVSREMLRHALEVVTAGTEGVREALVIVPEVEPVGVRILLAEDNELNIQAFEDYLEDLGYEVVVARNGREAVARAIEMQPDLILMDIQMPELDGLEAIRRLRARPEFTSTPIIALTALAMPGDRECCLAAGASEYLTKPIRLKGLVEIIEKLLQQ